MKVAPLVRAIKKHNDGEGAPPPAGREPYRPVIDFRLVHTGQHYDEKMSDIFFAELGIPAPDINLGAGSGSHAAQTAQVMMKFEPVCETQKPDWVVVVGDVNSTLACTLVASKLGIKVAHVEAGLRSFDRTMPEELNRLVTDCLADLLLTPSAEANENLQREGIPEAKIRLVGNIMIDALLENLDQARKSGVLNTLGVTPGNFGYVTLHRPANVDHKDCLLRIMRQLGEIARRMPVVFPVHPRTKRMLQDFGLAPAANNGLRLVEPVGYHDSLCLCESARFVLTDSGGLQEEATFFRTPCLTLRPNTERPITIALGSNRLTSLDALREDFDRILMKDARLGKVPPLWDGNTARRIVGVLTQEAPG